MNQLNGKNYTILLFPQEVDSRKIEKLREAKTGSAMIDGLLPHATLKRRFALDGSLTEDELTKIVADFNISKFKVTFDRIEKLGNALVVAGNSEYIMQRHEVLLKMLAEEIITQDPEYEGGQFKMHMTLLRGNASKADYEKYLSEINFDKLCLYELDPSAERLWARKIYCKEFQAV